jgi:urease accessory protein
MHRKLRTIVLSAILVGTLATPALAHVGTVNHGGFAHGFMHPLVGLDHILAMVAVGMLAARLGGRAMWLVPAAFIAMMMLGGLLGFAGVPLAFVEQGIWLSVIVLGVLVALGLNMPTALAMGIVGVFAVFHGHAHGTELPDGSAPAAYVAGFVLATAVLHAAGIGLGIAVERLAVSARVWTTRTVGAVMTLSGVSLFAQ